MARNHNDMAKLLEVTTEYGNRNKLLFNPEKSAVVIYSPHEVGRKKTLTIQGQTIPVAKNYKYLGITLSDSRNYLNAQEEAWAKGANSALHAMHATSLWGFNRFEITRVQWKATAVPKLTYANSVLVRSANLRDTLDRAQRKAGKLPKAILKIMELTLKKTRAYQETERLRAKYKCSVISLQLDVEGRPPSNIFNKKIKERIRETQEATYPGSVSPLLSF
ncbi:uncharacterized protein LOC108864924 [Galendromus occidentalis]|uniref:Uncharacterized protein LOC108864924 n=1 Tax=Galendromus occidentalis TaxID=34638 RepID=A0AAJ7PAT5_9ACAR|nr:uncharacterized protein LOC108864924 [Galendromus occidentalis]